MKYIVENCPNIKTSIVDKTIGFECGISKKGELCKDVRSCSIRMGIDMLLKGALNLCLSCEGTGYKNGCTEDKCLDYNVMESLKVLGVRGLKE